MRALVVSNMAADRAHPERGSFVRDQVAALRELEELDVELHEFPPGARALARAASDLRGRFGHERFDVVHAHFALSALPALAQPARKRALTVHGTDVRHPRTRLATRAILPVMDLVAAVSAELAAELPGAKARRRAVILPCGVDMQRFHPIPRVQARTQLGLDPEQACLLFAADPGRPGKRFDLARTLAVALDVPLLTLGSVKPDEVPLWHNAANAVLVPSDREGFGLAVLEALACEVPVLATPVGIHPEVLEGLPGTLCAAFDLQSWQGAAESHLATADPRIAGRDRAGAFSAERMAMRVAEEWRGLLGGGPRS